MIRSISGALAHKRSELGQKEKGFTLIELLVVVIIICILAAIAIPIFLGQQDSAKDSGVKSDLATAKIAVVSFYNENTVTAVGNTPTLVAGGTLVKFGFAISDNTTSLKFGTTGTSSSTAAVPYAVPTGPGVPFCIVGLSKSNGTPAFNITDAGGVRKGGTCGVDSTTAY